MLKTAVQILVLFAAWILSANQGQAVFVPGDVYVGRAVPGSLYNISAGGNFNAAMPFATLGSSQAGQLVWSPDLSLMYATVYGDNKVVTVTSSGVVTDYATGLSGPTGLVFSTSGRLLVSEFATGQITDITGGGNFSAAAPFASGLSGPRNLLRASSGQLFVTEQSTGEISNVTLGGVIGPLNVYASGFSTPIDIVAGGGGMYVAELGSNQVTLVTTPGSYSAVAPFASGVSFIGLAITQSGRILAAGINESNVYDITAGGNFAGATPFADMPPQTESALDIVAIVPEVNSAVLLAATGTVLGVSCYFRRRYAMTTA